MSVSRQSIEKSLSDLKNKRDVDYINPKIIIDSMSVTGHLLEQIVNESLYDGQVPDILKVSTVGPVPKKTRPKYAEDYRPINSLSTLEKLLEAVVKEQLMKYIEENQLLSKWQSGYRKMHSCETALNLVIAEWKEIRDNGKSILCVFLVLKRAFETIDRTKLLKKLQ